MLLYMSGQNMFSASFSSACLWRALIGPSRRDKINSDAKIDKDCVGQVFVGFDGKLDCARRLALVGENFVAALANKQHRRLSRKRGDSKPR